MKTIAIKNFAQGIQNDPRSGAFRTISNFDVFTDPNRAKPYYDSESGSTGASTQKIVNYCVALGSAWGLYGLGTDGSTTTVYLKEGLTTGGANDLDDAGWGETAKNNSAANNHSADLFHFYKKTGYIYGARANRYIFRYDPVGSTDWADTHYDLTSFVNISQAITHSKDDIMYFGADNRIIKNDNGSFSVALTLPSHLYVTSVCEAGNNLAIACAPLSGVGHSIVYLWDRDSSLTTLSESINWGEGVLKVLEELEGALIGISAQTDTTRLTKRITFKYWLTGSSAKQFNELTSTSTMTLSLDKQKVNNRVYFQLYATINGTVREGVWSISKENGSFVLTHERTPNNDTLTSGTLLSFFFVGDFLYQSYILADGSTYGMSKTNDTASYTHTSVIETSINQNMPESDKPLKKKLYAAALSYDPLPANSSVTLRYRVDGGSWTTIFTETTTGTPVTESSQAATAQFTDGREYEFQVQSTGGASITGIYYKYDTLPTLI